MSIANILLTIRNSFIRQNSENKIRRKTNETLYS